MVHKQWYDGVTLSSGPFETRQGFEEITNTFGEIRKIILNKLKMICIYIMNMKYTIYISNTKSERWSTELSTPQKKYI